MSNSILTSTKKVVGLDESYTAFDQDIIMHINTALSVLSDIGIGPEHGYIVTDKEDTWDDFIGESSRYISAKSYVYAKVKVLFDPPGTSFHLKALEDQMTEMLWRLSVRRESTQLVPVDIVLDGGDAYG